MPLKKSIKTSSVSDFEPKRKNPISLGSDSNIDNDLKPLTIGGVPTGLEISNDTIASNVENFVTLKEKTQQLNVSVIKGNKIPSLGEPQIIFQNSNATDNSSGLWLNVFTDGTTFLKANDGQFAMAGTLMSFIVGDDSGEDFLIKSGTFTSNVDIFRVDNGGSVFLKEQSSATTDETAFGQIWVKNSTPNELYFRTDAGDDIQITSGTSLAGGGGGSNFITDNADDTMAGTLTIDKDSTGTTTATTKALVVDFDQTGIAASGQTVTSQGLAISVNDNSVTHVGTHSVTGIVNNVISNNSGTSTATGILNNLTHPAGDAADTSIGFSQTVPDGGVDIKLQSSANLSDKFEISTGANGATTLETVDADAQLAHLTIQPDGKFLVEMNAMDGEDDAWAITNNGHNAMTFKSEEGAENYFKIYDTTGSTPTNYFEVEVQNHGVTMLKTIDSSAANAHLTIQPDGDLKFRPTSGITTLLAGSNVSDFGKLTVGTDGDLTISTTDAAGANAHLKFEPDGSFLIKETANAGGNVANYGQLWVKNDTPNNLYFTDDSGQDVAITNNGSLAGGGGGGGTDTWNWQQSMRWYTRYGYYYYPNATYGATYYNWSSASSSALTSWNDAFNPCIVVPKDMSIKSYHLYGNFSSTNTYVLCIKKGTPSYGSAGNTSLSTLGSEQTLVVGTSAINVKMEETGLSVSLSAGDIIIPTLRRTTNTGSSAYAFLEGVLNIVGEYS